MSQIHVQWSHFLTAIGYCWFWWCCITKVYSVHHIISVSSSTECAIGGLQKCPKFGCSGDTFCFFAMETCFSQKLILLNIEFLVVYLKFAHIFTCIMSDFFAKNSLIFYKNEPVWRISHTALLLLLTFSCFFWHSIGHIAHLRHFCILCTRPKSCFGGLNERWAATLV